MYLEVTRADHKQTYSEVLKPVTPLDAILARQRKRGARVRLPPRPPGRVNVTTRQPPLFLAFKGDGLRTVSPACVERSRRQPFPREAFQHASHSCAPYQCIRKGLLVLLHGQAC